MTAPVKSQEAFRTISEVADSLGVPQHVLRFWETKFSAIKPVKRSGNRRYYRPEDIGLLRAINALLYTNGYTIRGVQKLLKDMGVDAVVRHNDPLFTEQGTAPSPLLFTPDPGETDTQDHQIDAPTVHPSPIETDQLLDELYELRKILSQV